MLFGEEVLGFRLLRSRNQGKRGPIFVNWLVTAKLARVDRRGKVRQILDWRRSRVRHVGRDDPTRLIFPPPSRPGFYRLEIVFRDGRGRQLGRFGKYIRALAPSINTRLALDQTSYRPGDLVAPHLENYGAMYLFFGLTSAHYERYDGATWTPASFGNGPKVLIGLRAGPGASAACWSTTVPEDAPPGQYRVSLNVRYNRMLAFGPGSLSDQGEETLTAEFDVTG